MPIQSRKGRTPSTRLEEMRESGFWVRAGGYVKEVRSEDVNHRCWANLLRRSWLGVDTSIAAATVPFGP